MADKKNPPDPPVDPPPEGDPPPPPRDEGPDLEARIRAALDKLVASGELLGGGGENPPPDEEPAPTRAGAGPDFDAAVARVLERRDAERQATEKQRGLEQTVEDLKTEVAKGARRVKRWFEPWSPWSE